MKVTWYKDSRKRLEVFYNLHKKIWSVRHRGKVLEHTTGIELEDVSLDVQPAGNARVRNEKRKNVHAFIRGKRVKLSSAQCSSSFGHASYDKNWKEVTYNPYKHKTFVFKDTGKPVKKAERAVMDAREHPKVWVYKGE